jgi:hypothetical protein
MLTGHAEQVKAVVAAMAANSGSIVDAAAIHLGQ